MRLIINGDDFGITHACNLALIDCYKSGVMTSASLMTNMPAAREAASLWEENPGLSVGIHFCLTAGRPLTSVPSLIKEDGTFDKAILHEKGRADLSEIRQELQAQYDRFVELTGRQPDHINSHHGIELIYGCSEILEEFSRKYDIPLRSFITGASCDVPFETAANRFAQIDHFCEPEDMVQLFQKSDVSSDNAFELAAHPGYVDKELVRLSSLTTGRAYDAACFLSPRLKSWIEDNHIERISYKQLKRKENE